LNTVIINLDYETFPIMECRKIRSLIEKGMSEAGFTQNNRLFISNVDSEIAFARARDVMHRVERECRDDGVDILHCARGFYGIPCSQIVDLIPTAAHEITVDFMASGTFQRLFPGYS